MSEFHLIIRRMTMLVNIAHLLACLCQPKSH